MVDAGDVLQCPEGRHLPAQPQQLIDVFPLKAAQELPVLVGHAAVGQLLLRAESKVQPGVEGENSPFLVE